MSFRIAVLISGEGSNLQALIDGLGDAPVEIVGVGSSRADSRGLERAEAAGLETAVFSLADEPDRDKRDRALADWLEQRDVELVVLAGFMELLTAGFIRRFAGRIVNIHPALLPSFTGLDTHRRALEAGARIHGCSVHFVTAQVDNGPIIAQAAVPVLSNDSEQTLAARVLKAEHQLYPLALRLVAEGRARMQGGRTVFDLAGASERVNSALVAPDLRPLAENLEDLARFTP